MPVRLTGLAWHCHRHSCQHNPAPWLLPALTRTHMSSDHFKATGVPSAVKGEECSAENTKHDRVKQHLVLMGEKVKQKIQWNLLWLSCEHLTVCICADLLVSVFTDLKYECRAIIYFSLQCRVRRNSYWFMCNLFACAWTITLFQSQLTALFPFSPHVLSCYCFVLFFFISFPFSPPWFLLLATISPGLQLPPFPAHSPWNPPRTINVVWKYSLGKHEL